MPAGTRRRAREAALKILFQLDMAGGDPERALGDYFRCFDLEAEGDEYAGTLVRGVAERREQLDAAIAEASSNWRVERMASVDRNVLRIGAFEILHCPDVPASVVLDEAIELAKRYGAEGSAAFVNGVLDHLARTGRPTGGG